MKRSLMMLAVPLLALAACQQQRPEEQQVPEVQELPEAAPEMRPSQPQMAPPAGQDTMRMQPTDTMQGRMMPGDTMRTY